VKAEGDAREKGTAFFAFPFVYRLVFSRGRISWNRLFMDYTVFTVTLASFYEGAAVLQV
jgi:hypothetical protein